MPQVVAVVDAFNIIQDGNPIPVCWLQKNLSNRMYLSCYQSRLNCECSRKHKYSTFIKIEKKQPKKKKKTDIKEEHTIYSFRRATYLDTERFALLSKIKSFWDLHGPAPDA